MAKRVVFLGPPSSGKGTQAKRLALRLGVPAISTGEMLRAAVAAGNELGRRVEGVMAQGHLVDDALMAEVVTARLHESDARQGFLLDGYPRTAPQASTLQAILEATEAQLDHVLLVEAPIEILVQRTLGRNEGRQDDTEEIVRERLRVYAELTAPLVDHYESQGLLRRIDGNQPMDVVERQIAAAVEG